MALEHLAAQAMTYEAAIEPLARLAGVLGRWGAGSEHALVMDAIKGLHAASQAEQAGWVSWVALKNYPTALVNYAYGMGLIRANRLQELYQLLNTTMVNRRDTPIVIGIDLSPLHIEQYDGMLNLWKSFEGQRDKHAPLSNRLHDSLAPRWAPDFAGLQDPGLIYERFEFLSLLFYCMQQGINEDSLVDAVKTHGLKNIVWGRLSWNRQTIHRFIHDYASEEYKTPLLAAGFALGSERFLELMLEGLKRFSRY